MPPVRICYGCKQRLTDASNAIRRHASLMSTAIQLARSTPEPSDEERKAYRDRLVATFNDSQSAWDAYRDHLIDHGLLPAQPTQREDQ